MKVFLQIIAALGLALTIIPSFLFLFDAMSLPTVKLSMTIGMLLWIVAALVLQNTATARSSDSGA